YSIYKQKPIVLTFSSGLFCYSSNDWIRGFNKLIIRGSNETSLKCTKQKATWGKEYSTIHMSIPIDPDSESNHTAFNNGDLINAPIYSNKIKVSSSAIHKYFNGDLVLINGYEQQFTGYPPNPR